MMRLCLSDLRFPSLLLSKYMRVKVVDKNEWIIAHKQESFEELSTRARPCHNRVNYKLGGKLVIKLYHIFKSVQSNFFAFIYL